MMFRKLLYKYLINFRYAFSPKKPLLVFRLIKNYLDILFFGKKPLRYVDFAIGYRCNLNCEHCFAAVLENQHSERKMELGDYRRVSRECMGLGAVNFSFQGGEPLLYPELEDYIRACNPRENLISVTTNGILLTKENVLRLKRIGVDILTVSLDSGLQEEHDNFRGMPGTFDKVIKGIKLALENGLHVTIGAVVSHKNLESYGIKKLICIANELRVILNLILAVPIGRWRDNKEVLITEEDMNYIRYLTKDSPYIRTDFEANYLYTGCGAVKEILYLTPYGDVLACPFIHISLGNVVEESIQSIRKRALRNDYFCKYYNRCLAANDGPFMRNIMSKIYRNKILPVSYDEVFEYI